MLKNNMQSQKGVAVYIAIVIMTALLAIALGISTLVQRQAQTAKDLGDSIFAFYAADAGIERLLQLDICLIEEDEGVRYACIYATITLPGWTDAGCDGNPINDSIVCREQAIANINPLIQDLINGAKFTLVINPGGPPCPGANYCGESTGEFEGALRRIEISR